MIPECSHWPKSVLSLGLISVYFHVIRHQIDPCSVPRLLRRGGGCQLFTHVNTSRQVAVRVAHNAAVEWISVDTRNRRALCAL